TAPPPLPYAALPRRIPMAPARPHFRRSPMPDTVKAAVQLGTRSFEVRHFPMPRVGPDNGLVRIERSGICGSDAEQYLGHMGAREMQPTIRGHEPLGIIEEVGERAAQRW